MRQHDGSVYPRTNTAVLCVLREKLLFSLRLKKSRHPEFISGSLEAKSDCLVECMVQEMLTCVSMTAWVL